MKKSGIELITDERKRQIEDLGFDYNNDSLYADEQLAKAGAVYALPSSDRGEFDLIVNEEFDTLLTALWPWDMQYFKPTPEDRIKELSKAGALIAAQIDWINNNKK